MTIDLGSFAGFEFVGSLDRVVRDAVVATLESYIDLAVYEIVTPRPTGAAAELAFDHVVEILGATRIVGPDPDSDTQSAVLGLDCPACGDLAAWPDEWGLYREGDPLVCGCPGFVTVCAEDGAGVWFDDETPTIDPERDRR